MLCVQILVLVVQASQKLSQCNIFVAGVLSFVWVYFHMVACDIFVEQSRILKPSSCLFTKNICWANISPANISPLRSGGSGGS